MKKMLSPTPLKLLTFIGSVAIVSVVLVSFEHRVCSQNTADNEISIEAATAVIGIKYRHDEAEFIQQGDHHGWMNFLRGDAALSPMDAYPLEFRPAAYKVALRQCSLNEESTVEFDGRGLPDSQFSELMDQSWGFASISQLQELLRQGRLTSTDLTKFFIDRLKERDSELHFVVSILEDQAIEDARESDKRRKEGKVLGPLDGIPFGIKDLFATSTGVTAWGSPAFENQQFDYDATVVSRLRNKEGAILVAKLSLGELAFGDVWYKNDRRYQTRSPWNPEVGAWGSSAGPAVAVAAGTLPFTIGTETWGSLITPGFKNGVVALRPTFDRVSRYGVMPLSFSMDKVGPICRYADDCLKVFLAIHGQDDNDLRAEYCPVEYGPNTQIKRVGYLKLNFESYDDAEFMGEATASAEKKKIYEEFLSYLRHELGYELVPIELPVDSTQIYPGLMNLKTEATAVFQDMPVHNRDELLGNQPGEEGAGPSYRPYFLQSTLIPAFDNHNAARLRSKLAQEVADLFQANKIDLYLSPNISDADWSHSLLVNLTGHPGITFPVGFTAESMPVGVVAVAPYFKDNLLVRLASDYQKATNHHYRYPQ